MKWKIVQNKDIEAFEAELNKLNDAGACPCIYGRMEYNEDVGYFVLIQYTPMP